MTFSQLKRLPQEKRHALASSLQLVPSSFGCVLQPTPHLPPPIPHPPHSPPPPHYHPPPRHAPAALFLHIAKEGMGVVTSRCSEDMKTQHQKQPEKQCFICVIGPNQVSYFVVA